MRKFKALLVLNLKAMLNSVRFGGRKQKLRAASGVGAMIFMAGLAVYISGIYSFMFASQLAPVGMLNLVIMMMAVLAVASGTMFTIFATQGVVFGGRDNDLMLSLPIPAFTLMLARTLALYVENLVFSVFIMLPAGVAYLAFGGDGGVWFIAVLLLCTVFLALLPTLLSLVVGFVLAWMSSKFGRRALVSNILYCGAFLLLIVFLSRFSFAMADIASYATGLQAGFSGWGWPFLLLSQAACEGNILSLLLFLALCVLPFLLAVWLFAGRYKQIVTGLGAKSARSDYKLGTVTASGARRALLAKESRKFFGTPIYLFNTGFGLVMLLAGGVASILFRGKIALFLDQMTAAAGAVPIAPMLCAVMLFIVSMTAITSSSISLEGRQLWVLKEAPVSVGSIFAVKAGFQLMVELPCILISIVCFTFSFSLSPLDAAAIFLVNAALAFFSAVFGLYINLCFPKLDAANDAMVVKQSMSAVLGIFLPLIPCVPLGFLWVFLQGVIGSNLALVLCAVLLAALGGAFVRLLNTRGKTMWLEL